MNKRLCRLFLLLCLCLAACNPSESEKHWQLEIYHADTNQTAALSQPDISGKWLVINYWAEWCKPCVEEMPELNRLASTSKQDLVVLGFNFDGKHGAELQAAMQRVGMSIPALLTSPDSLFTIPEINGLPTTLILNERGEIKAQLSGPQTYDKLRATIATLSSSPSTD